VQITTKLHGTYAILLFVARALHRPSPVVHVASADPVNGTRHDLHRALLQQAQLLLAQLVFNPLNRTSAAS
jgi:hypothetical protein